MISEQVKIRFADQIIAIKSTVVPGTTDLGYTEVKLVEEIPADANGLLKKNPYFGSISFSASSNMVSASVLVPDCVNKALIDDASVV